MSYTYPEALNAMEKIAEDLLKTVFNGRHVRVSVRAEGQTGTASVDWELGYITRVNIYMPVRPATYRMTQDEFDHWAAYILHEVGHPAHTDKMVWDEAVRRNAHRLLNALEDVREEKATIDLGLANNARQVFSRLIDMLHAKAVADGYDPNNPKSIGWTLSTLGRHANGYAVDVSDIYTKLNPNGVVGRVVSWAIPMLGQCRSTRDCLDLADKIVAAINAATPKKQPKEPEPAKANGASPISKPVEAPAEAADALEGEKAPEMPSGDENAPTGSPEAPSENASRGDEPESDGGDASADEPEGDIGGTGGENFSDADVEENDLRPNERDNVTDQAEMNKQGYLTSILRRVAKEPVVENEITGRNRRGTVELIAGNASKMGAQRALLARALKANDLDTRDSGRASGRLDMRSMAKMAAGSALVFGKRTIVEGYETDVQVLVDGSSSMIGDKMQAASTLALVVSQAASQVGVACFVHVFSDYGLAYATKGKAKPAPNKFGYMAMSATGSTPLTESMMQAATMQKQRAGHKRKIMFVITDGCCNSGAHIAKAAGEYIEQTIGVEIANLHIGHRAPGMFRNEIAVNPGKVNEVGLRQLTQMLERGI